MNKTISNFTFTLLACLIFLISSVPVNAQQITAFQQNYQLNIKPTSQVIKIDGILEETVWTHSEVAHQFKKKFPNDIGETQQKTEVRFTYDDKNIYFAFKVYDSGRSIIRSLKRDIGHDGSDGVGVILDPLNQKTNGFFFVLNALNVQSEDQLSSSTDDKPGWSWDTKWFSATKNYGTYWIAEIMIPFKSIRFDPAQKQWGINFLRIDAKNNEYSAWTKVPVNFRSYDLGYTGILHWPTTPPKNSNNIIFLPYVTGNANEDKENNQTLSTTGTLGFDGKFALNSSLNVDLTVNPDFSQVEVDQQVTNLTRFNIFLPERRNFFLENSDLFSSFGIPPIRPFYSRSIGLDKDGNKIPIVFGARLSGNIGTATRIGLMDMQTGRQGNYSPENFSALTVHRRVFKRSSVKGYFLNRENYISDEAAKKDPLSRYGRNAGGSFEYTNTDGSFASWISYHQSIKPNINTQDYYAEGGFMSNTKNWSWVLEMGNVGKNYYTDMGYVQRIENYDAVRDTTIRVGFKNVFFEGAYTTMPAHGKIGKLTTSFTEFLVFNPDNSFNEGNGTLRIQTEFKNTSGVIFNFNNNIVNLLYPISFNDGFPLPATQYRYSNINWMYNSDFRQAFAWNIGLTYGEFYNGYVKGVQLGFNIRKQPHLNFQLKSELNTIELPKPYGSTSLLLIQPRVEWNFNTKLFWTTFVQYNTQSNNFSVNSRLQYRYKPMSDFYLVYTDNYFTDPLFINKNRALIFKFSYWFNL